MSERDKCKTCDGWGELTSWGSAMHTPVTARACYACRGTGKSPTSDVLKKRDTVTKGASEGR